MLRKTTAVKYDVLYIIICLLCILTALVFRIQRLLTLLQFCKSVLRTKSSSNLHLPRFQNQRNSAGAAPEKKKERKQKCWAGLKTLMTVSWQPKFWFYCNSIWKSIVIKVLYTLSELWRLYGYAVRNLRIIIHILQSFDVPYDNEDEGLIVLCKQLFNFYIYF